MLLPMKKSQRRIPARPAPPGAEAADPDRRWMEKRVLGTGDLLVYGRLAEELRDGAPEDAWKQLRAAAEAYLAGGADRAGHCHRTVDATIEALVARDQRFGYPAPFCHKGCCNCCHEPVYCTDEEARLIHAHCLAAGLAIDRPRLERQLRHLETDERQDHTGATTWNDQPEPDQACGFLDPADGACRIWPVRPLVCRVHLAEGTDAHCRPHNGQADPEARGIDYLELSYILTAVFTIHRDSIRKTMGRLLLDLES